MTTTHPAREVHLALQATYRWAPPPVPADLTHLVTGPSTDTDPGELLATLAWTVTQRARKRTGADPEAPTDAGELFAAAAADLRDAGPSAVEQLPEQLHGHAAGQLADRGDVRAALVASWAHLVEELTTAMWATWSPHVHRRLTSTAPPVWLVAVTAAPDVFADHTVAGYPTLRADGDGWNSAPAAIAALVPAFAAEAELDDPEGAGNVRLWPAEDHGEAELQLALTLRAQALADGGRGAPLGSLGHALAAARAVLGVPEHPTGQARATWAGADRDQVLARLRELRAERADRRTAGTRGSWAAAW